MCKLFSTKKQKRNNDCSTNFQSLEMEVENFPLHKLHTTKRSFSLNSQPFAESHSVNTQLRFAEITKPGTPLSLSTSSIAMNARALLISFYSAPKHHSNSHKRTFDSKPSPSVQFCPCGTSDFLRVFPARKGLIRLGKRRVIVLADVKSERYDAVESSPESVKLKSDVFATEDNDEDVVMVPWWEQFPRRWVIVLLCFSAFLLCNMDRVSIIDESLCFLLVLEHVCVDRVAVIELSSCYQSSWFMSLFSRHIVFLIVQCICCCGVELGLFNWADVISEFSGW